MTRHFKIAIMRRALRCASRVLLGSGLLLASHQAHASQSAKLVYARTADAVSCGEELALRQAVARRLGYDPFVAVSDNTVVAELRGDGGGLMARVFVIERGHLVSGTRELTSKSNDCEELRLAVALAISIAIDPDAIERVPEPEPEPEPRPEPLAETSAAPEAPPPPTPPAFTTQVRLSGTVSTKPTWRMGAAATIGTGPLPSPTAGFAASVEVASHRWSLGIEPRWQLPNKTPPQTGTSDQATTTFIGGTLVPCYRISAASACYLAELGRLASRGLVSESHRDASSWAAQGLRLAYHFGGEYGLGATAKLDGLVAMNRINLYLNTQPVWQTPWLVGRLGIELNFAF